MQLPTLILIGLHASLSLFGAELYVSPTGNDAHPATATQPLATLARARDLARTLRGEPVSILLGGGTYYLSEPLLLDAQDSRTPQTPLVIAAAAGQQVTVSGGARLKLQWEPFRDGILQAQVPPGTEFDQLFVDGRRQPMARYPNYDPTAQYFQGFAEDCASAERASRWADPTTGFLHAMHRSLWGDMHWQITGKAPDGKLQLEGGWQNNRQMGAHAQYRFVENIFEELDAPGEWFLNTRTNTLYYFPQQGAGTSLPAMSEKKTEVVRLRHLIEFRGSPETPVRNITLEGLTLTHTVRTFMQNKEPLLRSDWTTYRGGAILFDGAEDCGLRNCQVDQVGGNAVFINEYNRRIQIVGCHIANAGASAIALVGAPQALRSPLFEYHQTQTLDQIDKTIGPKTNDYPAECLIEDCLIYRNGRVEKQTAGVNICMAESITIRHCSIYDCPRAGINICDGAFGGHLIEFNDVFDTVKETGDHGSFNSWGRDRFWHPDRSQTSRWVAEYPDMPQWDCHKTITIQNNRWRCDHGWDIDLDDGSSNYELRNNLCLAGGIKLREGYFRSVCNNILVDYTFCPHVWYPNCHTTFQHNIIWQDTYAPAGMKTTDQTTAIDFNLVHRPSASLTGMLSQPAQRLQQFGADAHSLQADAQFVDPAAGDYRVRAGSPALALGFQNFPMDQFGVQKPELKRLARSPVLPGTLAAASVRSGGWGRQYAAPQTAQWQGATIKNIETDGELSAVGLGDRRGVLLVDVPDHSAAAQAGLKVQDVIQAVDNKPIANLKALAETLEQRYDGQPVTLHLWRQQTAIDIPIVLQ